MQFNVPVSVRLDKHLFSEIKRWSKRQSLGIGAAIRFLLVQALEEEKSAFIDTKATVDLNG